MQSRMISPDTGKNVLMPTSAHVLRCTGRDPSIQDMDRTALQRDTAYCRSAVRNNRISFQELIRSARASLAATR